MNKYEYKVIPNNAPGLLDKAGEEGWLVVSENEYKWTLMRELKDEEALS